VTRQVFKAHAAAVVLLSTVSLVSAGAWTQPPGDSYLKLTAQRGETDSSFDDLGNQVPRPGNGLLTDFGLWMYGEYGLASAITLIADAPYRRLSEKRQFAGGIGQERSNGLGDLSIGLRWRLRERPLVVSVAAGMAIPLGYSIQRDTRLPLGTDRASGDFRILVGRSITRPLSGYITGEAGYRARRGSFSNEVLYSLEVGVSQRRLTVRANLAGISTVGVCGAGDRAGLVGDQDRAVLSPGLVANVTPTIQASVDVVQTVSGCNTSRGTAFAFGLALAR
jgi:hypothetical protein